MKFPWKIERRREVPQDIPQVVLRGAEVTVSNAPPKDMGEMHSRLWVQFLTGAVEMLVDEVARGIGDVDEKNRQIAEKLREIAVHNALYPDSSRDEEYMQAHIKPPEIV